MDASESKLPLHEDIMQLARLGEIGPIQSLFEQGKFKATHTDAENITPLHVRLDSVPSYSNIVVIPKACVVGCNQQSLRSLSIPHRARS